MGSLGIPVAVLSHARRAADEITRRIAEAGGRPIRVDAVEIITGRAALLGLSPNGRISAGGATRLMPGRDSWCALTLSRPDSVAAVPALLETDAVLDDPWPAVQHWVAGREIATVTDRARLLGLPAATLGETAAAPPRTSKLGRSAPPRGLSELLVADLSSMWAGPLCGQLLTQAGATVVKVESSARPDGTRAGPAAFFDWMNSGKLSYTADFDDPAALRRLLAAADVVIESSRPAALERRGLGPQDVAPRDGRVWLRITGHGTDGERADWVAFGDDAPLPPPFSPIADPLTGLHAALAVFESLSRGGGELLEMSMAAVAATYAALPVSAHENRCPAPSPQPPPRSAPVSPLGEDNAVVTHLITERYFAPC